MGTQSEGQPGPGTAEAPTGDDQVAADVAPGSPGEPGGAPRVEPEGYEFGSFEFDQAVGAGLADLQGTAHTFRAPTLEEEALDGAAVEALDRDVRERARWSDPVVDGFRGALRLATVRTPPRRSRIL